VEWFVDGAHTEDSLAGVGQWFAGKVGNGDEVRVLVFNQQERDPAVLLKSLLSRGKESSQGLGFKHAIFCRNEDQPAGKDGPARDLAVQKKARDAFTALDENATTSIHDSAQAAIAEIRSLAAEGKKNGKACKVLVTGSFHLIGPVLKTIDHVEY
jgi:folylpolyglutamate synthase